MTKSKAKKPKTLNRPKKVADRFSLVMVVGIVNGHRRRCWVAADDLTAERLKQKGYRVGSRVGAEFKGERDGRNWARIHKLGQLLIENTDDFTNYKDAHKVVKRIQLETGIGCEESIICLDRIGLVKHRQALSLAFDAMDDEEFQQVYSGFCQYIINKYWAGLEVYQIEDMANLVGLAA